jgi:hypothetical protein
MASLNLKNIEVKLGAIHKQFSDRVVQVGFPKGANYEDGTPVAYVAAIQEFGAPAAKIPPRPFFAPAIKDNEVKWVKSIRGGIVQVTKGNMTADGVLEAVGLVAVGDVQASIEAVNSPPLAPATIKAKGFDKPLQDTGLMLASVSSKVTNKGEDFTI